MIVASGIGFCRSGDPELLSALRAGSQSGSG
jgi:hypothetical protein